MTRIPSKTMIGKTFNRLTVIRTVKRGACTLVECQCLCGEIVIAEPKRVRIGRIKSCGCYSREKVSERFTKHGLSTNYIYRVWQSMISRCTKPKFSYYHLYGGRGITVCERWRKFENFVADMGMRPSSEHSLDRIDNDGNYEPSNCRWATRLQQNNNKRSNHFVTCDGVKKTLIEWSRQTGVPPEKIARRIKNGWPIHLAIFHPGIAVAASRIPK